MDRFVDSVSMSNAKAALLGFAQEVRAQGWEVEGVESRAFPCGESITMNGRGCSILRTPDSAASSAQEFHLFCNGLKT